MTGVHIRGMLDRSQHAVESSGPDSAGHGQLDRQLDCYHHAHKSCWESVQSALSWLERI
jgi:hypothetical protein